MPKGKFKNLADTITSFFYNEATSIRNYLFPDKDGTVAMVDDLDSLALATIVSVSGATTLTDSAFGKLHVLTGASDYTVALPAASGNSGRSISFLGAPTLTAIATIDGNAAETINGIIIRSIGTGGAFTLVCDGTGWVVMNEIPSAIPYTPTLTGIASTSTFLATYKLIGKVLHLKWVIAGTGDGTTAFTISLPANMITGEYTDGMLRVQNNVTVAAGRYFAGAGATAFTINSTVSGGAWTASTARQAYGQLTVAIQ